MDTVSFEEMGALVATFKSWPGLKPGDAVEVAEDRAVCKCRSGKKPCGVALSVGPDLAAAVRLKGAAQVRCTDTAVVAGWAVLAGDGSGGVKSAADGVSLLVLETDRGANRATVLF